MNEYLALTVALFTGVLLGALFFGGLWWTVRQGMSSRHPAAWFLGSLLVRSGSVVAGFYFVSDGHWPRLLACLVGFVSARSIVVRRTRPPAEHQEAKEAPHAP